MATTRGRLDKMKRLAGVIVAAGAVALAGILGSGAVANAAGPVTKVGSDPVTSVISGIADAATSGGSGVEIPPLVSPWPGGAWAGHDWSKGYPGGGLANGKGGGAAIHGKAGGAWNHR